MNPMLARWVDFLLRFDMKIVHVPGAEWKVDRRGMPVAGTKRIVELVKDEVACRRIPDEIKADLRGKTLVPEHERQAVVQQARARGHFGKFSYLE